MPTTPPPRLGLFGRFLDRLFPERVRNRAFDSRLDADANRISAEVEREFRRHGRGGLRPSDCAAKTQLFSIDDGQTYFAFTDYPGEHPVSKYDRVQEAVLTAPRMTPAEAQAWLDAQPPTPAA